MHSALATMLLALGLSGAAEAPRVLVGQLKVEDGAPAALADTLGRVLEGELRQALPDVELVTYRAVAASLERAEAAACLGDEDAAACAAELGAALGVDLIVSPHLGGVGSVQVLTVAVYRVKDATVAGQGSRRAPAGDEAALLDLVRPAVEEAFATTGLRVATRPPPQELQHVREVPAGGGNAASWALAGTGVGAGALLALAGGVVHAGALLAMQGPYERGELTREEAQRWEETGGLWLVAPWFAYAAGFVVATTGLALGWVLHE